MAHKIFIEYESGSSGGETLNPEDRWSRRSDRVTTVLFKALYRQKPGHLFFYDSLDLSNDKMLQLDYLYLAVVRYSTGDTFGRNTGLWYLVGLSPTHDIAKLMLSSITKAGSHIGYKPWEGYFNSLEGTETYRLPLIE